jgi:hypothetical protein
MFTIIKKISKYILIKSMINNSIEHNTIKNYFNFISNCLHYQINNTAVFYPIGDYYYLFYNENIGVNANDFSIKFENDGIYKNNNEIYFYVCFKIINVNFYLENIKNNDIILLDKNFLIAKVYKKINNFFKNKKSFLNIQMISKNYNFTENIGIIQNSILKNDFQKINNTEIKKDICENLESCFEKQICRSNASSFDNFEDFEIKYRFLKKNFSDKELDDYVVL